MIKTSLQTQRFAAHVSIDLRSKTFEMNKNSLFNLQIVYTSFTRDALLGWFSKTFQRLKQLHALIKVVVN